MIVGRDRILDFLFYSSIFLFPIDSFPLFPVSTVYRPLSVLILVIYSCFLFITNDKTIKRHDLIVILGSFLILFQSFFTAYLIFEQYHHLIKVSMTVVLLIIILISINDFFVRHKDDIPFKKIIGVLKASFIISAIVGLIQFTAKLGLIPIHISDNFTTLFTYRSSQRIQMLSGEPAMMIRHLLLFLIFFLGIPNFKNRKTYILSVLFFILISGSTYGYMIILIAVILYVFLFKITFLIKPAIIILFIAITLGMMFLYQKYLDEYTVNKIDLVVNTIKEPSTIETYLKKDGSVFQRIINPTIGFKSIAYTYGLGAGLDSYRYMYPIYILRDYPYAMNFESVRNAVLGKNYITPKSLYSKMASELGLIPFTIYIIFLITIYFKIKRVSLNSNKRFFLEMIFVGVIIFIINNDSLIFVNFYFLIYLLLFLLRQPENNDFA